MGVAYFDVQAEPGQDISAPLAGSAATNWRLIGIGVPSGEYTDDVESVTATADSDGLVTFAVLNLGWDGMDADDPLTAESFTLTITDPDTETVDKPPCGCATGIGGAGAGLLGAALLVTCRRKPR